MNGSSQNYAIDRVNEDTKTQKPLFFTGYPQHDTSMHKDILDFRQKIKENIKRRCQVIRVSKLNKLYDNQLIIV